MTKTAWAALGGLVAGLIIAAVIGLWWLPGPRGSVPTASPAVATDLLPQSPSPTRTTVGLPNPDLTPGSINPKVTQENVLTTICTPGWTATVRPPNAYTAALKLAQIVEYGYADRSPSHYEEDHLVALEIGGAPRDPRNLWPQPKDLMLPDRTPIGSSAKDGLEDYLHSAVCAGVMPLGDAQRLMAGDWVAAWEAAGRP
jgi:hypothetical protein